MHANVVVKTEATSRDEVSEVNGQDEPEDRQTIKVIYQSPQPRTNTKRICISDIQPITDPMMRPEREDNRRG